MGDNSPESSDGRTWGAVTKRLLLGKAHRGLLAGGLVWTHQMSP